MASFDQSPLGQTTQSTGFATMLVSGSSTVNAVVIQDVYQFVVNATGNTPAWYALSSPVQSEGRRESKMIGAQPSPRA